MELIFAGLAGILIGIAARYAVPHRDRHGAMLVPAVGGVAALAAWAALTWIGGGLALPWLAYGAGWIWWIALTIAAIAAVATAFTLGSARARRDEELFDRLKHLGRAAL